MQKTISGIATQYLHDAMNPVQELQNGSASANLVTGLGIDEFIERTDASGAMSFLSDNLGSTLALADPSGVIGTSYAYEPFGKTTVSGPSANPYQFAGRENDGTGLYFNRARYYRPSMQRWIAQDPMDYGAGDVNLYSYAFNDPVTLLDPSGLDAFICDRSLHGFPGEWWRFYHQYICITDGDETFCFGLGPAKGLLHSISGPGRWEFDNPTNFAKSRAKTNVSINASWSYLRALLRTITYSAKIVRMLPERKLTSAKKSAI